MQEPDPQTVTNGGLGGSLVLFLMVMPGIPDHALARSQDSATYWRNWGTGVPASLSGTCDWAPQVGDVFLPLVFLLYCTFVNWPRSALVLTAIGFLGFGVAYAGWPIPMARMADIPLPTPTARIDFAATYGGVQLALAVFFLVASRRSAWLEPGLWAAAAVLAGLILVRLQGILATGESPAGVIVVAIAIELTGLLACVHALRYQRRTVTTP